MIAEWLSEHGGKRRDACGGGGAVRGGYRNIYRLVCTGGGICNKVRECKKFQEIKKTMKNITIMSVM